MTHAALIDFYRTANTQKKMHGYLAMHRLSKVLTQLAQKKEGKASW